MLMTIGVLTCFLLFLYKMCLARVQDFRSVRFKDWFLKESPEAFPAVFLWRFPDLLGQVGGLITLEGG